MRLRHALRQIGEERRQFGADFGIGIDLAHRFHIFRAALLHHCRRMLEIMRQAGERGGHDLAEGARALAAAEHQQAQRRRRPAAGYRARPTAPSTSGRSGLPVSTILDLSLRREAGDGKGGGHQLHLVHHQPVGAADHGILLDDGGGQARQTGRQHHRHATDSRQSRSPRRASAGAAWRRPATMPAAILNGARDGVERRGRHGFDPRAGKLGGIIGEAGIGHHHDLAAAA